MSEKDDENKYLAGGMEVLLDTVGGKSVGEAIKSQEARGQRRMIARSQLPKSFGEVLIQDYPFTTPEAYAKMGIKIIGEVNDLFYEVELPAGWKIDASGHSMWSTLVDAKGRERGKIFYKAAFYDRSAFISLRRRFTYKIEPEDKYGTDISYDERSGSPHYGIVYDAEVEIWRTQAMAIAYNKDRFHWFYDQGEKRKRYFAKLCQAFLEEHYPGYNDFFAYWD